MHCSFLDSRTTQALVPGQLGRFTSLLKHRVLCYMIATLLVLTVSAPMGISAQTAAQPQTQSEAEVLAAAARLAKKVLDLLYQARPHEALPLAKRALSIREQVLGPDHPNTAASHGTLGALLQAMGGLN